LFLMLLCA
ncbi:transcriptional regulator ExsA, partial [Vibrio harveyi]